jgi:hypothetical protein
VNPQPVQIGDMRAGRTPNVGGRAVNPQPVQIGDRRAGRTPNVGGRAVNPQPVQIGDRRAGRPHAVVVVQLFGAVLVSACCSDSLFF